MANSARHEKILKEARDRLKKAMDEDAENRKMALDDLRFISIPGAQWPEDIKAKRESKGRPCLEINKMPAYIDQVVGDQRMNRPSIKVIPVDSNSDPKVAKLLSGWIKHVQAISASDVAIDHGFEHAVACAYGAIRVVTKYVSDSSFEQEVYIKKVDNALAVFWGKHSEYDCSDAKYCFLVYDIDREEFKDTYKTEPVPFNQADSQYVEGWATAETVRVAEYFVKEPIEKTIYLLSDDRVVDEVKEGEVVSKKRKVKTFKIMWYLLSGNKVLDEREWIGRKYIPVIPIWGKEYNVGGKRYLRGLIRNGKDPQRMLNYWESCDTEVVALQPRAPYILTAKQLGDYKQMWDNAQNENYPYMLVEPDKDAPGWPQRQAPPQVSSAMVAKLAGSDQAIRDTIGLQKASMGMQSNERSGAAIRERKKEGDVGTFAFIDNLSRSMEHLGRVLIDIAPRILDSERIVRLGLEDGSFEFDAVNVKTTTGKILNDLSMGTYDVVVTVGPSFTTQRTEAQISMKEFIQYYPQAAPLIGDLYAKAMDWAGADEIAKRLEFLLPPEIQAKKAAEEAKKAGVEVPPPSSAPAPPPSPVEVMQLEEEKIKLNKLQIELKQEMTRLEGMQLDNEIKVAQSKEKIKQLLDELMNEAKEKAVASTAGGQNA